MLPPFAETTTLLARWLEGFGEPVHVVGHSMGGELAIRLAAERPDLIRSLVLVNAAGVPFALRPAQHAAALRLPPFGGMSIWRVLIPDFLRAGPTSVAIASARVLLGDARVWMERIRVPALLVWGEGDPLVPLEYGEEMKNLIPGAQLAVIPRAAHVAMWDNAPEFNRVVLEFVAEVEKNPPPAASGDAVFAWGVSGWTNGIASRQAGPRRDLILLHGLGMSSAYFINLARVLFGRGWNPIAPDLPGFGESADAAGASPEEHARILVEWADALGIRDAVWVGHSSGCNAVAHLARLRPDLCRQQILIGPLWTRHPHPLIRMFFCLALDALREPLGLYRFVIPAYWRAGLRRWWKTFRLYMPDIVREAPPHDAILLSGERDPIPDRNCVAVTNVAGAHACTLSDPDAVSSGVGSPRG